MLWDATTAVVSVMHERSLTDNDRRSKNAGRLERGLRKLSAQHICLYRNMLRCQQSRITSQSLLLALTSKAV